MLNPKTLVSVLACLCGAVHASPCQPKPPSTSTTALPTSSSTSTTASPTTTTSPTSTTVAPTSTTTTAATCPTPSSCNNLGFGWAYFNNPAVNNDATYSSFDPASFKSDNPIYVSTTNQLGGLFQSSSGGGNGAVGSIYGSSQQFPLSYFALNQRGYLFTCDAGTYTFSFPYADDAIYFWIGAKAYSGWTKGNADANAEYNPLTSTPGSTTFSVALPGQVYIPVRLVYGEANYSGGFKFSITSPSIPQIVIVGAGPSGLLLALLLAQQNISSTVLESWPELDTRLRATQYGVPATRVFRRAGILDDVRAASISKFPSICWRRVSDHKKLIDLDLSLVEDRPDRMTIFPLGEMIKIMYRHCMERGRGLIEVKFNHEVTSVGQDENTAWVDVDIKGSGSTERARFSADYVVGCDGASSAVRHSLFGRTWPGQTLPYRFVVQNVFYDGFEDYNWDGGNYMIDPDHCGLIAHRGKGGLWRVTYGDPVLGLTDEEYLNRRPTHMKAMLPGHPDPTQYRIEQTNLYNIHNRCADTFKVGRVILAGDAAHVCNPMGGYGCMSAVLDVGGLAECFSGYFHGMAGEEILEKYAQVRRDIFLKYVDPRSIKNLNRVAKSDPQTVLETDKFFGILKDLQKDDNSMREFLLKVSSIEHDFTQHYRQKLDTGL
ncbi:uncharacterized protein E0L32_003179 [Thyridium curvatum]|uniref:PA14 domain-containing protein n=1 Tax=Thyridium curvatum TaxID=1093900 RepID=A0A507BDZ4_9PEZI|nr:uncharacterized protein E0L32_003179 [Thyridium curvatum]TPX17536.1 hypothetical protein E0L32_003179 [Thyridium curvatum]